MASYNTSASARTDELAKNVLNYEVPFDIAHDLVNPEDVYCNDIKCLRPSVTSPSVIAEAEVLSKRICFEKQLRPIYSPHPLAGVQNPAMGIQSLFSSFCMTSSPHHSYHTWQAVNFNNIEPATSIGMGTGTSQFRYSSMVNSPHRSCHTRQAVDFNINRHVKMQTAHMKPSLCNVIPSARLCAPLIWMAKRSIK